MANAAKIPLIDLAAVEAGAQEKRQVAEALAETAIEHGFIYIRNTGSEVPASAVDEVFDLSKRLFAAPLEEKQKCTMQNNRGWAGMNVETLDPKSQRVGDFKEVFNFNAFVRGKAQQPLPTSIAQHEGRFAAFSSMCQRTCIVILSLLGIGLEILTQQNTWVSVPVSPPGTEDDPAPPILVNIGDLLSYWTNGLLRSTVHRVVFAGSRDGSACAVEGESGSDARYSIAYFCHPEGSTPLTVVPSAQVQGFKGGPDEHQGEGNEGKGDGGGGNLYVKRKAMTADEHLAMRLRATYLQMNKDKE